LKNFIKYELSGGKKRIIRISRNESLRITLYRFKYNEYIKYGFVNAIEKVLIIKLENIYGIEL
jgi:hypothetical protein